jgi:nitrilase
MNSRHARDQDARRVRVAVVQDAPVVFDTEGTLERIEALTASAADAGAELVLFPEAFLPGYPFGLTFGAAVGTRTPEGRELYRRYWSSAIDVPGPATERLSECAAAHRMHLVLGVIERAGGTLYCCALFFGPDGRLLGKHRKLVPTAAERLVWGQGDGSTLPVIDTAVGRLGAVICWENYMPLLRATMYGKGVELYLAPTADDAETWIASMRHIAKEGRCFVLSACQFLRRADCPDDYPLADQEPEAVLLRGGSCIVAPTGELVVEPDYTGPRLLTADLDLGEIPRGKFDLDVVGHYARADVFSLRVDERPKVPVELQRGRLMSD